MMFKRRKTNEKEKPIPGDRASDKRPLNKGSFGDTGGKKAGRKPKPVLSKEAKARQREGQAKGREKRWQAHRLKKKINATPTPDFDPHDERYEDDPVLYISEQFYIPENKGPIELEKWQIKNLQELFSKDPKTGLRRYNLGVWSTPKKNGKSTISAAIANRFLFQEGDFGEVIFAANSREQATLRAFQALKRSIQLNPTQFSHCKIGEESIENQLNHTVAYVVSKNLKTVAGSNASLILIDEMWALDLEVEEQFIDELTTSPARKEPLTLITSYAGFEETGPLWDVYQRGIKKKDPKMWFFWSEKNLASWITKEYLKTQRTRLRPNSYLRLHENKWTSSESAFIDLDDWDACVDTKHHPVIMPNRSLSIVAAVDASVSGDSTAITAVANINDRVALVRHRKWAPKRTKIDFEVVEEYIRQLHRDFYLKKCLYDPYQMVSSAQRLVKDGIRMEPYNQTVSNLTAMGQNLYDLIINRILLVYKCKEFRKHAQNATAQESARGWKITKKTNSKKVDLIVSLAMAAIGLVTIGQTAGPRVRPIYDEEDNQKDKGYWGNEGWEDVEGRDDPFALLPDPGPHFL
ncbi:MAG: terminase large subunit [Thermodesulfobacteriota bacterium]|nr:terminase large subunit [Thermodesulfobacteriota bacterium]